ncbi:MAG: amidohydrolase family protein, partial [Kiritimatiellales bacterium]
MNCPMIDTHLHIWDTSKLNYPWLKDVPLLNHSFLIDDYREATKNHNIEKMVFMQCEVEVLQYRDEVSWVSSVARNEDPRITGIVAWAPLEKGAAAREDLDWLAQNPLVKGVRRIIQFEPDLEFCLRPGFIAGVKLLADYNFTFDICIDHRHYENTIKFIEQLPEVPMILDHIGKPDIKGGQLDPWRGQLRRMAAFENVCCKFSSLATEADKETWVLDDLRPYVDCIVESFGFDRLVFGGDWPVVTLAAPYDRAVE